MQNPINQVTISKIALGTHHERKQVRVNKVLLNEAIAAAEAEAGVRFTQIDVVAMAMAEFIDRRREALVSDAISRIEEYTK